MVWKVLSTGSEIDLVSYVKGYIKDKPKTQIFIGTDSQTKGPNTWYAIVIVLYTEGKGGHVVYTRIKHPRIKDIFNKLFKEVHYSIEVAELLRDSGIANVLTIDLDFNLDKKYKSNALLTSSLGWCAGLGFETRCKPYASAASYAADMIVKKK